MRPRTKIILRVLGVGLSLAILAVIGGLVPLNIGVFSGVISRNVHEATGLDLSIGGPVVVRLGPRASLDASDLSLDTPAGGKLLEIDEAKVRVSLLALLRRRVHVHSADVKGLRADYCESFPERPASEASNDSPPPQVAIDDLRIAGITVLCEGVPAELQVDRLVFAAPADGATRLDVAASLVGNPVNLNASGGGLDELLGGSPFGVEAALELQHASLTADGELALVSGRPTIDLRLEVEATDALELGEAFDLPVPDLDAVEIAGQLRGDLDSLELADVAGAAGLTRFSATGRLALNRERPGAELDILFEQLDLAPFFGDTPDDSSGDTDLGPLLTALKAFDADLRLKAGRISGVPIDIRNATLEANLVDGVVELTSAQAELLDGQLDAAGRFDSRPNCPSLEVSASLDAAKLEGLREAGWLTVPISGQVERTRLETLSCGTSVREHEDRLAAVVTANGGGLVVADEVPIDLSSLEISTEPAEGIRARASARVAGGEINAAAAAGSLQAMLGSDAWPVHVDATGGGSELRVDGKARIEEGQLRFEGNSEFLAPQAGSLRGWLDVAPDVETSLAMTLRLDLDASRLRADDIRIDFGDSDLYGMFAWHYRELPDTLSLVLRSSFLDLDEIGALLGNGAETASDQARPGRPAPEPTASYGLPRVDLDLEFDAVRAGRADIQDLAISGRLEAGLVDDARVSALIGDELSLRGELDIDIRQLPAAFLLDAEGGNVDLGRLLHRLELVDDLEMRADSILFRLESTGVSTEEVLANADIDVTVHGFSWDIPQSRSDTDLELRLETVELTIAPGRPLGASTSGTVDDMLVELWIQAPGLDNVLGDAAELPLHVVAAAGDDVAMIDLLLDRSAEDEFLGRVEVSGQVIGSEDRDLAALVSPLDDYAIRGNFSVDEAGLSLTELEARLGTSMATGNVSLTGDGRQHLEVELRSPRLQTDDLAYLPIIGRTEPETPPAETAAGDDRKPVASNPDKRGPLRVANDVVVRYQQEYDLDLSVSIDELYAGSNLVGGADVELHIDEDELRLKPVSIRLPGGGMDAEYAWRIDDGRMSAELVARAESLVYGGLIRMMDPTSEARGVAYLDVDFRTETDWSPDVSEFDLLLANANGTMDVAIWPETFEADLLDLWTANLVFALLPAPADGETSRLNCLVARLEAEDGVLKTKNVLLDSTATIIRGRGKFDLAQNEIDLLVTPQAKREKFFSASTPVKVTGPVEDFQVGVEPAGFLGTLLRWYTSLIYVPFKWLTGQRFPPDGTQTCFDAMDWELTPELEEYFRRRDFSAPPAFD